MADELRGDAREFARKLFARYRGKPGKPFDWPVRWESFDQLQALSEYDQLSNGAWDFPPWSMLAWSPQMIAYRKYRLGIITEEELRKLCPLSPATEAWVRTFRQQIQKGKDRDKAIAAADRAAWRTGARQTAVRGK